MASTGRGRKAGRWLLSIWNSASLILRFLLVFTLVMSITASTAGNNASAVTYFYYFVLLFSLQGLVSASFEKDKTKVITFLGLILIATLIYAGVAIYYFGLSQKDVALVFFFAVFLIFIGFIPSALTLGGPVRLGKRSEEEANIGKALINALFQLIFLVVLAVMFALPFRLAFLAPGYQSSFLKNPLSGAVMTFQGEDLLNASFIMDYGAVTRVSNFIGSTLSLFTGLPSPSIEIPGLNQGMYLVYNLMGFPVKIKTPEGEIPLPSWAQIAMLFASFAVIIYLSLSLKWEKAEVNRAEQWLKVVNATLQQVREEGDKKWFTATEIVKLGQYNFYEYWMNFILDNERAMETLAEQSKGMEGEGK